MPQGVESTRSATDTSMRRHDHRPHDFGGTEAPTTMDRAPSITVIIPTFRREDAVVRAIGSALCPDIDVEVLVIDDSPERSAEAAVTAIDDPRVRYVAMDTPTGGRPALVRNLGIQLARHDILYFLDDDDQVLPGALSAFSQAFADNPDAGVAFGRVECVGPDERTRVRYQSWFDHVADSAKRVQRSSWITAGVIMFRGTVLINSCCSVRRSVAIELGGYDAEMPVYEDVDFFTRGIRLAGHCFVDVPVLRYSTGMPSIIHDLDGDNQPIVDAHGTMYEKYRARWGRLDFRALQVICKLLPLGSPFAAQDEALEALDALDADRADAPVDRSTTAVAAPSDADDELRCGA